MRRKRRIASTLVAVMLLNLPIAMAQKPAASGDWIAVQTLAPGDELVVNLKDGRAVKGKLTSVTDAELSLTRNNMSETFGRDRIFQIYRRKRKAEKGKYAAIH